MRILLLSLFYLSINSSLFAQNELSYLEREILSGAELYENNQYLEAIEKLSPLYQEAKSKLHVNEIYDSGIYLVRSYIGLGRVNEAGQIAEELIANHFNEFDDVQKHKVLDRYAYTLGGRGKRKEASSVLQEVNSLALQLNDSVEIALSYNSLGANEIYIGNYSEAISTYKKALGYSINDPEGTAYALVGLFTAHNYNGEIEKGYPYLAEAYEITRSNNFMGSHKQVLLHLTNYHYRQNKIGSAFSFGLEGLELSKASNDAQDIAMYYRTLGELYREIGNVEQSLEYLNASIDYYESIDNYIAINSIKLSIVNTLLDAGEYKLAGEILEEIIPSISGEYDKVIGYDLLASVYRNLGDPIKAKEMTDLGIEFALNADISNAHWVKSDLLYYPDSLVSQHQKIEVAKEIHVKYSAEGRLRTMLGERMLARAYEPFNPDSAFKYAYLSIDKLEDRRFSTASASIKNIANAEYQDFYYTVADWEIMYNEDYSKAFELFEKSKSRSLFDQIFEHQQAEFLSIENPLSFRALELQKKIDRFYQQLTDVTVGNIEQLSMEISLLELEYETLLDTLVTSNPKWAGLKYPAVTTLEEAQELLDDETAMLSYGLTNDELFLLFISKNEVQFFPVESDAGFEERLNELVNNFREAIINELDIEVLKEHSSKISQFLIDPVKDHMAGFKNLVIIPDGSLHLLPFEALFFDESFLVERFAIKYLPSVSVYNIIQADHTINYEREMLALAGSGFESGNDFYGSSSQVSFSTLPYSIAEVDSISKAFRDVLILKNEEVTEATFKNIEMDDFRFIHLATHGYINELEPSQSGLILSKKLGTELLFGEDGFLNAREISQLSIPADLVVLSACNTGTGKVINGEGVMGLQRSFLVAGASSVMVSLWSIYDRSTPVFMNYFYENLLEIEDDEISFIDKIRMYVDWYNPELIDYKTLALQESKIQMISHPYYDHPVHWAPFVLTGK